MKKFKLKSFCKINLYLKIFNKLQSGFHGIETLVTFCKIYDNISIQKINSSKDIISFHGKFKNGINRNSNTITKVLTEIRKRKFYKNQKFKINIKKNIPHGSGLGGGSMNAATLLNFFKSKISKNGIYQIAKNIGSDTPLGLEKKNTLITGKKNKFIRLKKKFGFNILIVYPNIVCSTKKIYSNYKIKNNSKDISRFTKKSSNNLINFLKYQNNDLEKIVIKFYPKIKKIIDLIKSQKGCYFSRITGSGSACVGIFSNMKTATYTQRLIKRKYPKYWCVISKTI